MTVRRTRITDILDAHRVAYRVLPHSEPVYTVETAAQQRGVVQSEMVKSILLRDREGRYVMAGVTGDARVDPKAVRAHLPAEWKRLSFATADEIRAVTGCVQGAVTPLGLPPDVPVILDEAIARCVKISISSGDPMAGLELDPQDLIRVSGARLGRIAEAIE
jgi:Cys-tRNA(Pro)/Cys-tRNA(Cys) deacylase